MQKTYYRVSWDMETTKGTRRFSHEFNNESDATAFFIQKQRKEQRGRLVEMELRKMWQDDNAPYMDEYGKYHPNGGIHIRLDDILMRYCNY